MESSSNATAPTIYYCDQCGARYGGPGICENQHPAAAVKPVSELEDVATDVVDVKTDGAGTADVVEPELANAETAIALAPPPPADVTTQHAPPLDELAARKLADDAAAAAGTVDSARLGDLVATAHETAAKLVAAVDELAALIEKR